MSLFQKDRDLTEPPERVEIEVRASDFQERPDGFAVRLDAFLQRHLTWRSRNSIQNLIKDGYVFVDVPAPDRPAERTPAVERRASRKLKDRARVVVVIPEELRLPRGVLDGSELDILYEDEEVLAVDKPAGMPVHPSGRHYRDTLIQQVHARFRAGNEGLKLPIRLCHRLDLETSGVILIAKGDRTHAHLMQQFEKREVEKEYLAVVRGVPEEDGGRVDLAVGPSRTSAVRLKMACVADGLPSSTEWRVVERAAGCALVSCLLHTGRQHQIRVHLDAIGYPLVGDKLYGADEGFFLRNANGELTDDDRRALGLPRHALHNHRLAFSSPTTGERREVRSPLAADLRAYLDAR
ncbi:MAG: RluA family pseudouridine synthase [Planctomycetota bacterium]